MFVGLSETPSQRKGRVLVVDDELALVRAYGRTLAQVGYDVVAATDGLEARDHFQQGGFDVVLTDVWMPGMDGLDLLRAVRKCDRSVPVIMMTGGPTADAANAAASNGALMYLAKPVELRSLLQIVDHALNLHKQAQSSDAAIEPVGLGDPDGSDLASCGARLGKAIGSLFMMFQPIVRPATRQVFGYEALLRSAEPTMTQALVILAAAERCGRVHELGRAVRACIAAAVSELPADAKMFVNLHPRDLLDDALFLADAPLSRVARRVVLELTERATLDDVVDLPARLEALRALGFSIAIDDLGAGYASLTAFARVHPEVVKLDIALVRDLHLDPVKRMLVSTLVTMSQKMGLTVVAEGVETVEERDVLTDLGCVLMQGYLFGRPERAFLSGGGAPPAR